MAKLIKTNGATTEVAPANGRSFTLEEMQGFVGGYIEALKLSDGSIMWLNEEGKLKHLPDNPMATDLAHLKTGIAPWDWVVGDVLIATLDESEGEDEDDYA